ncbi:MAG: epoxyqueuosine reductase [Chloroflexi bacterium]|nr:epoxyqueuosine reductase [Chloroflexota bacterium]
MTDGKGEPALAQWIKKSINDLVRSPQNSLQNAANERAWDEPIVGFSRGDDPLYAQLRSKIGDFYWLPETIFGLTFPQTEARPAELAIISWVLPQTEATKAENRQETTFASERWVRARMFGEDFNVALRDHVVTVLRNAGYEAVAPVNSPLFGIHTSDAYGASSTWSERHVAFISGLGTFGLCDGLITPVGKAMRCGSVVARIPLEPTPRSYSDRHAYCLFYSKGTCGVCIKRCPAGAISEKGHDKKKCGDYVNGPAARHAREAYGIEGYGCGLCQTKVPCESGIPAGVEDEFSPQESGIP